MIEINHLNKRFGRLEALQDINMTCEKGSCIALIGPNGCGKTTLIKSVLGMVIPDTGRINFNGKNIAGTYQYRDQIGYMPQIGRYPDNMAIGQIVEMIVEIRQSNVINEELIQLFNLRQLYDKKMRTLSGGTTQKVSATLAFLFDPEVLILDEPTAGLDPVSSEILKDKILKEKNNGKLIIITSHLLSELDDLITHLIFMEEGRIRFFKPIEELRNDTGEEKIAKAISVILKTSE